MKLRSPFVIAILLIIPVIISLGIFFVYSTDTYVSKGESPVATDFTSYKQDPRILYKDGMREEAAIASQALDESIKSIEHIHGKAFTGVVRIHICNSPKCFTRYTGLRSILAAVTDKGLFLAPYVFKQKDFPKWLTHELSHLHLFQQISTLSALRIPQWYHDGLATYASNGGGASKVSEAEAADLMLSGRFILTRGHGEFYKTRWPLSYQASTDAWYQQHMDYRQASMFYEYLHPKGGKDLISELESGSNFGKAFKKVYGTEPGEQFELYLAELQEKSI
uniref:hypothetical protein n=1 Tax=Microbulbifer agarilyticus TaxID=260552 RepID=UPI000255B5D8|nr:hypothetical protein [Microbulbifer agarilyticus]